jgi:hypothetical protein
MAETVAKKAKMTRPDGSQGDGTEVQIVESTERWSEFTLEDGTVLRFKMVIAAFIRSDNEYDPEGNPVYGIKGAPQVNFLQLPENLKKQRP